MFIRFSIVYIIRLDELYELGERDSNEAVFGVGRSMKCLATDMKEPPVAGGSRLPNRWEVGSGKPETNTYGYELPPTEKRLKRSVSRESLRKSCRSLFKCCTSR